MTSPQRVHDVAGWTDFYKDRDPESYQRYCEDRYKPFLALIAARMKMFAPQDQFSLELGCGIGTISAILGKVYPRATLVMVDKSPDMLMRAANQMAAQKIHENVAMFCVDILRDDAKPGEWLPSVVHSHGVLEHFSDEQAAGVVDRHRDHWQVHYLPGLYPEGPSYGDERLLPIGHWIKVLRPSRAFTFNGGLDYAFVFHPRGYH